MILAACLNAKIYTHINKCICTYPYIHTNICIYIQAPADFLSSICINLTLNILNISSTLQNSLKHALREWTNNDFALFCNSSPDRISFALTFNIYFRWVHISFPLTAIACNDSVRNSRVVSFASIDVKTNE